MDKTTVYLPPELKSAIKRVARQRGVSEAEVIRDSIRDAVGDDRPRPRGGLFGSGAPIAREASTKSRSLTVSTSASIMRVKRGMVETPTAMGCRTLSTCVTVKSGRTVAGTIVAR